MNKSENKNLVLILSGVLFLLLGAMIFVALSFNANSSNSGLPFDYSVADNNCCSQPNCPEYNGNWEAGFYACERKECSKCNIPSTCGNSICETGESHTNCSSDCDVKGFSQLPAGSSCSPSASVDAYSQCNETGNLNCTACPTNAVSNAGKGFCSTIVSTSSNYLSVFVPEFCGGQSAVCGNGTKETGEACDDGNKVSGDGCSATCTIETGANEIVCSKCTTSLFDGNACESMKTTSSSCPAGYVQGSNCAVNSSCPVDSSVSLPTTSFEIDEIIPIILSFSLILIGASLYLFNENRE